jgi:ribosomal subunit interface protein
VLGVAPRLNMEINIDTKGCFMTMMQDFDISITFRHEENDTDFREMAREEILRLSKYHSHIVNASLIIDRVNASHTAEIILNVPGHTFNAKYTDFTIGKAFDLALEKAKIQLKKDHDKILDHRAIPIAEVVAEELSAAEEDIPE